MSTTLRVIFAGTPDFAVPALQTLHDEGVDIAAVYTQPDRPAGRGRKLRASAVKERAFELGLPIRQPETLRCAATQNELAGLHADLMIVAAYGLLLPLEVLRAPRLGCINVHASLLPRWRGAAPIQHAILAGDAQTGITLMQMDAGLDTGDMLLRRTCTIEPRDTSLSLHDKLARLGAETLREYLRAPTRVKPQPQDESAATHAPRISKADALLRWTEPARLLERKVRAFNPWPVAQTRYVGQALRIWKAQLVDGAGEPGAVLRCDKHGIDVATGDKALRISKLQMPGGKVLSAADFLNAHDLAGACFTS
ncbi:MAG: methionyl-tRNA formyltransferase [Gammaproteobacteria bacterium]